MKQTAAKPRYLAFEAWEAASMLAGTMTQKRIPHDHWRFPPRTGALIWVQEPHVDWTGKRGNEDMIALGYEADAGGRPILSLQPPEFFKHRQFATKIRAAKDMRAGDSRLTLEVISTEYRHASVFKDGEMEAEGLPLLAQWNRETDPYLAFRTFWRRQYRKDYPVLIIRFHVLRVCVTKLLEKTRAA
jgi:hypothetical protein